MYQTFVARIKEAQAQVQQASNVITDWMYHHPGRPLAVAVAARLYAIAFGLQNLLCTNILDSEEMNLVLDDLYEKEQERERVLKVLDDTRRALIAAMRCGWPILRLESQLLSEGRQTLADLLLLSLAAFQRIIDDIIPDSEDRRSYSTSFRCVRTQALVATDEQRDVCIEQLSLHAVMNALHKVYAATVRAPYSEDFENYTRLLLWRGLDLLTSPGDDRCWNIKDYRQPVSGHPEQFRYSWLLLRDFTIIWHALSDHFDLAWLLPRCDDPRRLCQPSPDEMKLARAWILRHASMDCDLWVRDGYVRNSMYAGEIDFFHADHRGQRSTPEVILEEHRPDDFFRLMETAPDPPQIVLKRMKFSETHSPAESLHLSLIVLSTFRSQIKTIHTGLDPDAFVLVGNELRKWTPCLTSSAERRQCPALVLMFNHVQLWWNGQLLMYNNAVEALAAWMICVERRLHRRVEQYGAGKILDDFFYYGETANQRLIRLAAQNSDQVITLGTWAVF